ncbi:hypothetical protein LTR17_011174 [Elasticomyces elasticus]|nr:hypothetical protein LTR17_011174 [Elasticomyces elasticus]
MTTKTFTHEAYPTTTVGGSHEWSPAGPETTHVNHPGSPSYPVGPVAPGQETCAQAGTVTVTETIYASETSAPSYPAGAQTTETVTVTLGNGHATTIIVTYPTGSSGSAPGWPHGGRPDSPPYPAPESWSHSHSAPSGTAPAPKPYPTASESSSSTYESSTTSSSTAAPSSSSASTSSQSTWGAIPTTYGPGGYSGSW